MLKIGCLWMMLSISVTAFAQDTSSDCDKEYYDRYGRWMENHLVTWWGVPPVLMRSSGKYADLICEKLSEINYEDTHFFITFLIDENGIPYCSSSSWEKGMDGEDRNTIQEVSKSFRFISAKNGDLAAKSFYNFVLKRSKDSGQWHYSESLMFEKEQDKLLPDGNIVENMSLVIATDRDTVLMGDTVRVSLRFKNISDKDKLFYPGGVIMIYEKSMRMSSSIMPPSFILSKGKSDQLQNIPSGLVYEINYPVIVSSPLFKEGENRLMFRYHWGLNLSKKNVTDNIIYGNLYSKEVRTYVGSDLCVFGL